VSATAAPSSSHPRADRLLVWGPSVHRSLRAVDDRTFRGALRPTGRRTKLVRQIGCSPDFVTSGSSCGYMATADHGCSGRSKAMLTWEP
jgi:hypothetical protein